MAASDKTIGRARCPVCHGEKAAIGVSTKGLAYVTCNSCGSQSFARSARSDEKIRALLIERRVRPAPTVAAPAPPPPAAVAPPVPDNAPAAPPPKPAAGGIFSEWFR